MYSARTNLCKNKQARVTQMVMDFIHNCKTLIRILLLS